MRQSTSLCATDPSQTLNWDPVVAANVGGRLRALGRGMVVRQPRGSAMAPKSRRESQSERGKRMVALTSVRSKIARRSSVGYAETKAPSTWAESLAGGTAPLRMRSSSAPLGMGVVVNGEQRRGSESEKAMVHWIHYLTRPCSSFTRTSTSLVRTGVTITLSSALQGPRHSTQL